MFDGLYGRFQGDVVVAAETSDLAIATAAASIDGETAYGRPFEVKEAGIYGPLKPHLVVVNFDEDLGGFR